MAHAFSFSSPTIIGFFWEINKRKRKFIGIWDALMSIQCNARANPLVNKSPDVLPLPLQDLPSEVPIIFPMKKISLTRWKWRKCDKPNAEPNSFEPCWVEETFAGTENASRGSRKYFLAIANFHLLWGDIFFIRIYTGAVGTCWEGIGIYGRKYHLLTDITSTCQGMFGRTFRYSDKIFSFLYDTQISISSRARKSLQLSFSFSLWNRAV